MTIAEQPERAERARERRDRRCPRARCPSARAVAAISTGGVGVARRHRVHCCAFPSCGRPPRPIPCLQVRARRGASCALRCDGPQPTPTGRAHLLCEVATHTQPAPGLEPARARRVLILSADVGEGHAAAARALAEQIEALRAARGGDASSTGSPRWARWCARWSRTATASSCASSRGPTRSSTGCSRTSCPSALLARRLLCLLGSRPLARGRSPSTTRTSSSRPIRRSRSCWRGCGAGARCAARRSPRSPT